MLTSLISLRDDIIAGDYRSLYLIWLKASTEDVINEYGNIDEDSDEPDVPAGLAELNGALTEFVNVFNVDKDTISASAITSTSLNSPTEVDYSSLLAELTEKEKTEWLLRLINNEPHLIEKLKRSFTKQMVTGNDNFNTKRTVSDIIEIMMSKKDESKAKEKQLKEEKRLAKLQNIEQKQDSLWEDVERLIKLKKSNAYDEAVNNLKVLKELAIHKNTLPGFTKKVTAIIHQNSNLRALQSRIEYAKLV